MTFARLAESLVDISGTVRWTNFTEDIRIRAKADEILAAAGGVEVGLVGVQQLIRRLNRIVGFSAPADFRYNYEPLQN